MSDQAARYARHLVLPQVGEAGQRRLAGASVLLVGVGGLGSPAALYLAAAGVGRLGLVDPDRVALSNLQRQVLYATADVGAEKVRVAQGRLEALNPHVAVEAHAVALTPRNARALVRDHDVVLDGSDRFATRYLVSDACVLEGRPDVHASVHRFEGQLSVFAHGDGPCYRCLHPAPPAPGSAPSCAEGGVLGVLPGMLGAMQAAEALKLLLGIGTSMSGRLLVVDALGMRMREMGFDRDPHCAACGATGRTELMADDDESCGEGWGMEDGDEGRGTVAGSRGEGRGTVAEHLGDVVVLDVREPWEVAVASLPGSLCIPMREVPQRAAAEVPRDRDVVVLCHHGVRSAQVTGWLRSQGWSRVRNYDGGIERWSLEVDPSVPRY